MNSREFVENILQNSDIKINGIKPEDIIVHNEAVYDRIISEGTLGLGESYMDGWWDCNKLDTLIFKLISNRAEENLPINIKSVLLFLRSKIINAQNKKRAGIVAKNHYDLGNDLYMSFLDPYNQYTCGYFKETNDLNIAQEKKLDLICKKLKLKSTDRVLDIGCGWGGFSKYAAEHYGCHVTGISISEEQIKFAREFTKGLPVEILKMDYRDLVGQYDKILVCGMMEHVGYKNYRKLFKTIKEHLSNDGLFLLHTIGANKSVKTGELWMDKYIFPNGMLPSAEQISNAFDGMFVMEDWHNFGHYYDTTLMAWNQNFENAWPQLKIKYDERFHRMFRYYFLSCAGLFRARSVVLWQVVLSPNGVIHGYESIR